MYKSSFLIDLQCKHNEYKEEIQEASPTASPDITSWGITK